MTHHPAIEAAFSAIVESGAVDDKSKLIASKCRALMLGYHARWGVPEFYVLAVESLVTAPLYNPETQAKSRTFSIGGKLDLAIMRRGRNGIVDHKSTSEDIGPESPYWSQLVVEAQPSHYQLLEWLNGRKVDECVWDVMRKPDIRPKQVAKKDRDVVCRDRVYFGSEMSSDAVDEMVATERESLAMYEARLAYDCTTERPDRYFQRRTVPRLDQEIHEHATEVWEYSQEVILARRLNRHGKNSGACMNYNRPCKYLGICSGNDTPDSSNWRRKEQVHNELVLIGDGRDLLTNSRLEMFKTCRRKHYYSYELGIERVREDEDESEALAFGTLWHLALEAYFKYFMKGKDDGNTTEIDAITAAAA